jgi:hypothetical protein
MMRATFAYSTYTGRPYMDADDLRGRQKEIEPYMSYCMPAAGDLLAGGLLY